RQCHGPIHPTPSAWQVGKTQSSFKITPWKGRDELHPRFPELVDVARLAGDTSPMGAWIGWTRYWDTGHKAWFEAAIRDRADLVDTPGFKHYWHGSQERRYSRATLTNLFPEVRPFLKRAGTRWKPRAPEQCDFREEIAAGKNRGAFRCRLLRELSGVKRADACLVPPDVCRACCASWPPSADEINPVVASCLFALLGRVLQQGGVSGCTIEQASGLQELAERNLGLDWP